MESPVECTQCGVLMTSWCAAGSPTRYYQCPFCKRTLCSAYGEVFERGALGRRVPTAARPSAGHLARVPVPEASPDDQRWRELKGRAARWFARVEADGVRHAPASAVPAMAAAGRTRV
jgi:hypothetical protein